MPLTRAEFCGACWCWVDSGVPLAKSGVQCLYLAGSGWGVGWTTVLLSYVVCTYVVPYISLLSSNNHRLSKALHFVSFTKILFTKYTLAGLNFAQKATESSLCLFFFSLHVFLSICNPMIYERPVRSPQKMFNLQNPSTMCYSGYSISYCNLQAEPNDS